MTLPHVYTHHPDTGWMCTDCLAQAIELTQIVHTSTCEYGSTSEESDILESPPPILERAIPIQCTDNEYHVILTETDSRMRTQLILSGLGMLEVIAQLKEQYP